MKHFKNLKWPVTLDNAAIPQQKCWNETLEKQDELNSGSNIDILLNYWQLQLVVLSTFYIFRQVHA
jgi:hypothetical protein